MYFEKAIFPKRVIISPVGGHSITLDMIQIQYCKSGSSKRYQPI